MLSDAIDTLQKNTDVIIGDTADARNLARIPG